VYDKAVSVEVVADVRRGRDSHGRDESSTEPGGLRHWLFKTEPNEFSWDDLVRKGREPWTGVRNPRARSNLGAMRPGDLAFVYHTGDQKRVVGIATVVSEPFRDPTQEADSDRWICVDVAPVEPLTHPVTLARCKADPKLASCPLVRIARLSVMPITETEWARIRELSGEQAPDPYA